MKQILLTGLLAATCGVMAASGFQQIPVQKVADAGAVSVTRPQVQIISQRDLGAKARLQVVRDMRTNHTYKRLVATSATPAPVRAAMERRQAAAEESLALNENFEGCTGEGWLPDGWTVESKDEATVNPWGVCSLANSYLTGAQGEYAAMIPYVETHCDEWLITSEVAVEEGMQLRFLLNVDPVFMYGTDNVDWDTMEYTGDKVVAYTVRVNVSADGGQTWDTLEDYARRADMLALTFGEAMNMDSSILPHTLDLSAYAGKTVKIAFVYEGTDGQLTGLDDVTVGYPTLEASYTYPYETFCSGVSREFVARQASVAIVPPFATLSWNVTSYDNPENTSYTWNYMDPEGNMQTAEGETLTATYGTDYSEEAAARGYLYTAPELTATAPKSTPGIYKLYDYFQAGGKAEASLSDGTQTQLYDLGLSTFSVPLEGLNFVTDYSSDAPIFGFNPDVDKFWTDYTFQGEDGEGDYVHLTGIFNYYFPSEKPLVIHGGWALAKGSGIKADAEFRLDVIPLNDEGEMTEPIATATIKGSDIAVTSGGGIQDYLMLDFKFEQPVVMSTDVCSAYIVRLSGMNGCGEYFAPFQSIEDNPAGFALGWVEKEICMDGNVRGSVTPVYNYTQKMQSFAIMLDGYYPWLQTESTDLRLKGSDTMTVSLDSYHNVSALSVEGMPEWLSASLEGTERNDVRLRLTPSNLDEQSCVIKVKGPGVEQAFNIVSEGLSGIEDITAGDSAAEILYTLTGVRVAGSPEPGIYIVKTSAGKITKRIVK